jgi:hypothetical protein
LWKNCGRIVERFCARTIFPQFLPAALPVEVPPNLFTIFPHFFYNSSSFGRIWCIRIGSGKNRRTNNRRRIVETFGECRRPTGFMVPLLPSLLAEALLHTSIATDLSTMLLTDGSLALERRVPALTRSARQLPVTVLATSFMAIMIMVFYAF